MIITDDCISCGKCEEECPSKAINTKPNMGIGYSQYTIDKTLCTNCGICLTIDCPGDAIKEE